MTFGYFALMSFGFCQDLAAGKTNTFHLMTISCRWHSATLQASKACNVEPSSRRATLHIDAVDQKLQELRQKWMLGSMSYTTMDRYGDVKHIYAPQKANQYVKGIWWPDYGPMTIDFCDQNKMHPTNTIFENQIAKKTPARRDLVANPMGPATQTMPQFRRQPPTEALWSSTIIQPYKSGGRAREIFEGAWHRRAHESRHRHEEAQAENFAQRSMRQQELSMTFSPQRSMARSLSRLPSVGSIDEAPAWVAASTISSRPFDAAGLNGNARGRVYKDGASEIGLDPESPSAKTLARSRSMLL
eukprot:s1385_g12.t2